MEYLKLITKKNTLHSGKFSEYIKYSEELPLLRSKYPGRNDIEVLYMVHNNITEIPKCFCGNDLAFYNFPNGYRTSCSRDCANKHPNRSVKIKKTKLEKYGDENYRNDEQIKKTCLERYGSDNLFKTNHFKEKNKETCLERYGVEYISQSELIKEKVSYTRESSESVKNAYKKNGDNRRFKPPVSDYILLQLYETHTIVELADMFKTYPTTIWNYLKRIGITKSNWTYTSKIQKDLFNFIQPFYSDAILNSRNIISPQEIDIFIPSKNIGFELNGLFWHSIEISNESEGKYYHLNKSKKCEEKGIQLIHITDNSWINKRLIWESVIKQKLGIQSNTIYARKCDFKEVSNDIGYKFIENNHLQGGIHRGKYFGLFYNNKLVSIIQIGKPRFNKKYDYEILRFCNILNTSVVGGFSKLLKHSNINGLIVSYANKDWSIGTLYEQTGFTKIGESLPNYWYTDGHNLYSRLKFQKHKLEKLLKFFDPELSESENMMKNGYKKYFDSGNMIFEKFINK